MEVILPRRAEPPVLILASRRSLRSRACSAAGEEEVLVVLAEAVSGVEDGGVVGVSMADYARVYG